MTDGNVVYAVINNIPGDYHSSDLRNYFSQFIETKGFECFHFRHRPELQKPARDADGVSSDNAGRRKTLCCVVKLKTSKYKELVKMYHRKHWLDRKESVIPSFCHISCIQTSCSRDSQTDVQGQDSQHCLIGIC